MFGGVTEFQIAPARITAVHMPVAEVVDPATDHTDAIYVEVELRHYTHEDGRPLTALVRWTSPFQGTDFGDWFVPDVGMDILCAFPGVAHDGSPGGDLDEGYSLGFISSSLEPPVLTGLAGDLSATRRVYKGKLGVDHDRHLQGDLDEQVDGNLEALVKGNETRTIEGNEAHTVEGDATRAVDGNLDLTITGTEDSENVGVVTRLFRAAVDFLADVAFKIKSSTTLTLEGVTKIKLVSGTSADIDAPTITLKATSGGIEVVLDAPTIKAIGTLVELGAGAGGLKLMTEAMIAAYNLHWHPGSGSSLGPADPLVVGTHTTTATRAT